MMHYVKFLRGTPEEYNALKFKKNDTLYFICERDEADGMLYLGSKLIAGGDTDISVLSINELKDVLLSNDIADNSLIVYDGYQKQWVNKTIEEAILTFVGSTSLSSGVPGLVPAPPKGQTRLFLRSDGTWAAPPSGPGGEGYITSTSEEFLVSEDGELKINKIAISSVEGLEEILKDNSTTLEELSNRLIWGTF